MRNNPLDEIVNVSVEISEPASNDASFDSILLVANAPAKAGTSSTDTAFEVAKAAELADYGYTEDEELYKACSVAFSQNPAPNKLVIIVRKTTTKGDTSTVEGIKTTLDRALTEAKFYGVYVVGDSTQATIEAAKEWAEANEKLFAFTYTDIDSFPVKNTNYYRTIAFFGGLADGYASDATPTENGYIGLAAMAKCFGYDPGTETWALKTLSTVVPSALSTSQKTQLAEINVNTFLRYNGSNITQGGKTLSGEWIDVIRFRDWLKNEMQVNVFSVLKANRKVPYTDSGIGLIEGAMEKTLHDGQAIGGIAEDSEDSDGNAVPGYTVSVPKAADLTETERKSRKLSNCSWSARLAGAIHVVEIEGFLTF